MSTKNITATQKRDIVSAVLGSAFESYSWWGALSYRNGYDWDNLPADGDEVFAVLESSNPETDDEGEHSDTTLLTVNGIFTAVGDHLGYAVYDLVDDADIDADEGDCIVQNLVFGTVVYG